MGTATFKKGICVWQRLFINIPLTRLRCQKRDTLSERFIKYDKLLKYQNKRVLESVLFDVDRMGVMEQAQRCMLGGNTGPGVRRPGLGPGLAPYQLRHPRSLRVLETGLTAVHDPGASMFRS